MLALTKGTALSGSDCLFLFATLTYLPFSSFSVASDVHRKHEQRKGAHTLKLPQLLRLVLLLISLSLPPYSLFFLFPFFLLSNRCFLAWISSQNGTPSPSTARQPAASQPPANKRPIHFFSFSCAATEEEEEEEEQQQQQNTQKQMDDRNSYFSLLHNKSFFFSTLDQ
jgi:hypothetical protein